MVLACPSTWHQNPKMTSFTSHFLNGNICDMCLIYHKQSTSSINKMSHIIWPCSCLIYHCFACSGHLLKPEEAKWFSFVQPKSCTVCRNIVGTHEVTHTCALAITDMLHVNAQQPGDRGDARTQWLSLVTFASRYRYAMQYNDAPTWPTCTIWFSHTSQHMMSIS